MEGFILLIIVGMIQGFIGWLIARGKGRGLAGFWWSFGFSWVGWIIAAMLSPSEQVQTNRMITQARIIKETLRD